MKEKLADRLYDNFSHGESYAKYPTEAEETVWGALYFFTFLTAFLCLTFFKGWLELTTILLVILGSVMSHSLKEQSRIRMLEIKISGLRKDVDDQ